jgi:ribosomal peptide maturation radical SAM protein 1
MKNRVALVSMPFAAASLPAIGISLLQAELRQEGIDCDLYYPNLRFAGRIGAGLYGWLSNPPELTLAGEWIFSHLLFPERSQSDEAYRREILLDRLRGEIDVRRLLDILKARREAGAFLEDCLRQIDFSRYGIVGFTSTFEQNVASLALARLVKRLHPEIAIVFGGANCEADMGIELHRQFSFVDYVCSGEGDLSFPELVKRICAGRPTWGLDAIIARRNTETVVPPRLVAPVTELDNLPIPSYDDYFTAFGRSGLEGQVEPLVPLESSRGCWWGAKMHCTFCGLNGSTMAYRSKSGSRVLGEITTLAQKYGTKFVSVDNILDLRYLDSLFPDVIARELDCTFYFETKVNLKQHQVRLLSEAGVKQLQPGIESLSTPILKAMKKGCTSLQNIQFLKWARQYGIQVMWNILYGFPGEDPEEYARMAELIPSLHHLEPPDACPRVRLVRFSPFFTHWREFGFAEPRADRAYSYVYPFSQPVLDTLAYSFEFDEDSAGKIGLYAHPVVEAVEGWRDRASGAALQMQEDDGGLLLIDARESTPAPIRLREPLSTIYRLCDEPASLGRICQSAAASPGTTAPEVERMLDSLVAQRLMVKEGSSYLSLAIPDSRRAERSVTPIV